MSTTTTSKKSKEPVKLPMYNVPYDSDGYVESFLITQEDEIKEFFNQFGFVVVRDAITPQDCTDTIDEIWTMLEKKSTFNRNDSESWKSKWPEDGMEQYGSVQREPVFAPQFLQNRQNPNVYKAFCILLDSTDLLVNHDRCCMFRPTKQVVFKSGIEDMPHWKTAANLHLDMNPWVYLTEGKSCREELARLRYDTLNQFIFENNQVSQKDGLQLQAVLNLKDNQASDGGFWCVPGFHNHFEEYISALPYNKAEAIHSLSFYKTDPLMKRVIRVPMRAGSMVLWDQRIPHGSTFVDRFAQFMRMFKREQVVPERAKARKAAIKKQLEKLQVKWPQNAFSVSQVGQQVFGLKYE